MGHRESAGAFILALALGAACSEATPAADDGVTQPCACDPGCPTDTSDCMTWRCEAQTLTTCACVAEQAPHHASCLDAGGEDGFCWLGECRPCAADGDCSGGQVCVDGHCGPTLDEVCGSICTGGIACCETAGLRCATVGQCNAYCSADSSGCTAAEREALLACTSTLADCSAQPLAEAGVLYGQFERCLAQVSCAP